MSTLAIWCRLVQSRDVSLHNFDGLAMSGLAFSVAPSLYLELANKLPSNMMTLLSCASDLLKRRGDSCHSVDRSFCA